MLDPLHQFEIHTLFPFSLGKWDISFTNASLAMVLVCLGIIMFLHITILKRTLVPGFFQSIGEKIFRFVEGIVQTQIGGDGQKFIPTIFTLFIFIFFANSAGLLPYAFTVTSHLAVTLTLALFVFFVMTFAGMVKHGRRFFRIFLPSGVPMFIAPLLVPVEMVSYMARPVSLSIRLFANMVAGHIVLKIIACACVVCVSSGVLAPLAVFPFGIDVILMVFELFVAVLQAYVFTVLSCIYLNSTLHIH